MENGQADTGPETIDDLAQFLVDNPEADGSEPAEEKRGKASEESQEDNSEESTEEATAEDESEEDTSEEAEKQPSGLKFKVPVKGEDGAESTIEVDEKELIAGYQRHADYTRKTMELGNKEREITQAVAKRLDEGQNYYLQQAQVARAAVLQLAGLRSPQEMAQLAATDPSSWAAETERANLVRGVIAQIEQGMQHEQQKSVAQRKAEADLQVSKAWGILGSKGIDKPALVKIYDTVREKYGVPAERLANVTDPALIEIFRDAAAYQGLKDKKAAVVKKAQEAPRLPAQRQSVPKNEQANKRLQQRFSSGRAKLGDLAKWIETNNL
jgi:hypothetical protein